MAGSGLSQRQSQSQIQAMGQSQIQSLEILSMGSDDVREAVYKEVQENPALIVTKDAAGGNVRLSHTPASTTRISSSASAAGELESDRHQNALEAHADTRLSLQDYLLSQLHVQNLPPDEMRIGELLIGNLDSRGFHILAPVSLLGKDGNTEENEAEKRAATLDKVISIVQSLDPAGCCCKDTEESLLVQARQRASAPRLALFLLDGHFEFLNPPVVSSIVRKTQAFFEARSKLFGLKENPEWEGLRVNAETAEEALAFIRTLDPFPARDYSTAETSYITPDVYIEKMQPEDGSGLKEDFSKGIVIQSGSVWHIRLASGNIPSLALNPAYENYSGEDRDSVISSGLRRAREFISAMEERQATLLRGTCMIVKKQHEFFESGPGHLQAFRQKDVASVLGLHETTISRMANSKYLQCSWGLFPLKYFFVGAVGSDGQSDTGAFSRDKIKSEIEKILSAYYGSSPASGKKKLSDQKISDMLAERGIKVARRTVAKYRSEM